MSKEFSTNNLLALGIDPKDIRTSLYCHWEIEKVEFHLDRLLHALYQNVLPKGLLMIMIEEVENALVELRAMFNYLYEKERRR
jgi:hypothetical protein